MRLRMLRNRSVKLPWSNRLTLAQRSLLSYIAIAVLGGGILDALRSAISQTYNTAWFDLLKYIFLVGVLGGVNHVLIVYPLQQLEQAVQALNRGNLDVRVSENVIPELDRLGESFNVMAASLQDIEIRRKELVSDLAHELRTPLTVLCSDLELLELGIVQVTPEILRRLSQEAQRLHRLSNNMIELSKVDIGNPALQLQVQPIQPILQQVFENFAMRSAEKNCKLRLQVPENLPMGYCDRDAVIQILVNLITNALTHTTNGTITLQASVAEDVIWISVIDTGVGIAPEHLERVCERFWRVDKDRNTATGGSGVGLAIVKRLVELQGGTLSIQSKVGHGSTFQFSLLARVVK
jgi:signal transduction histidine kinase